MTDVSSLFIDTNVLVYATNSASPWYRLANERLQQVVVNTELVLNHLLALIRSVLLAGRQVHDANIVATMQVYGISRILTHNTADFARFADLITVVPLEHIP